MHLLVPPHPTFVSPFLIYLTLVSPFIKKTEKSMPHAVFSPSLRRQKIAYPHTLFSFHIEGKHNQRVQLSTELYR